MYATSGAEIKEIFWFYLLLEGFLYFLYYIFILLTHNKFTSNNGKKTIFNIDFLAQNINIKLVGFWASLSCYPPHLHITKMSHFLLSFRKCSLLLLLSNALKWRYFCLLEEYYKSMESLKVWSPNGYLLLYWLHCCTIFLLNKPYYIVTFYHYFIVHSSFGFPGKQSVIFHYIILC